MEFQNRGLARVLGFISKRDKRILKECKTYLPGQVFLCLYLDSALRSHNGTVRVVREMCKCLSDYASSAQVSDEATSRLGIHDEDDETRGRLSQALVQKAPDFLEKITILRIRLMRGKSDLPAYADPILRYTSGSPLEGSNPDPQAVEAFLRIFLCAIAMLVGVDIDPRVNYSAGAA